MIKPGEKFFLKLKPWLTFSIRLIIGFLLIFYLIKGGKLDFTKIIAVFSSQPQVLIIFLLVIVVNNFILSGLRYQVLLNGKFNLPQDILKLTMIGQFFNSTLPGAVTGDLVKGYYFKKINANLKTSDLVVSLICDRLAGLSALMMVALMCLLIFYFGASYQPHQLHIMLLVMGMPLVLGYIFLIILARFSNNFSQMWGKISSLAQSNKALVSLSNSFKLFKLSKLSKLSKLNITLPSANRLIVALAISLVIFTSTTLLIYYGATKLGVAPALNLWQQALLIPIGLIVVALPISPGGIGLGHVAFQMLYASHGIKGGADVFNIFIVVQLLVNLTGVVPYLALKNKQRKI